MVNVNEERVQSLSANGQRGLHCIPVTLGDFILTRIVHPKRIVRSFTHSCYFLQWRIWCSSSPSNNTLWWLKNNEEKITIFQW